MNNGSNEFNKYFLRIYFILGVIIGIEDNRLKR